MNINHYPRSLFHPVIDQIAIMGASLSVSIGRSTPPPAVNTTVCGGQTYVYEQLAGYGLIPSNKRDLYGDTIGGIGSAIAIDRSSWSFDGTSYSGIIYGLPDRGWNTEGTVNYQNRIQKIYVSFTPDEDATVQQPSQPNLSFDLVDTILLYDPAGNPTSGLDANQKGPYLKFPSIPFGLPTANYTGDGFGGAGNGGSRVVIDAEGLFLGKDGSFWISDEYGPNIYNFAKNGSMTSAIRLPNAFIPQRNASDSYASNNPPRYDPALVPNPQDPTSGRNNNQGLEGLTTNPDGTRLYALMQSALNQDGGPKNANSAQTRFVIYDLTTSPPSLLSEHVVTQSRVDPSDSSSKIARQSEIHYISPTQFLILARDGGAGRGQGDSTLSQYRHVDVFDITNATNIAGKSDCTTCSIASSKGVLAKNVTAATYCSWLDFNVNSQLNRFGVHNGGAQDAALLNEKWESLALAPVSGSLTNEYYLFSFSDNDFITQDGYLKGGQFQYSDSTGYNVDNQVLVFKVQLPKGAKPLVS
jgi:hypothetical protein